MTSLSQTYACLQPRKRPSLWARIRQAIGLRRQRRSLALLDPHMLRDLGITPDEAQAEAAKPLWDVPRHWQQ